MKVTARCKQYLTLIALLASSVAANAATLTGTVHNQTTGKPSLGDSVALVDLQAGMADVATAKTDSQGHYALNSPGPGPYLIRVEHQGASYFIAAPSGGASGDISIYDAAAKVEGVAIDADMLLIEASNGVLRVQERYLVRNTSAPPRAQFAPTNNFEVVIPADAILDGAFATRPGGLGTTSHLATLSTKGHYSFTVPIQPDKGEKETLFEIQYHIRYSGKLSFTHQVPMPADNLVVYMPLSMRFSGGGGFQPSQENPALQTHIQKNVQPGEQISFTVEGEGSVPREQQASAARSSLAAAMHSGRVPVGGTGKPIGSPDTLSKYKVWILTALGIALVGGTASFLLRRQRELVRTPAGAPYLTMSRFDSLTSQESSSSGRVYPTSSSPDVGSAGLSDSAFLDVIKQEMFALEKDRVTGAISEADYAQAKAGLEALLKRALPRKAR